MTRQADKVGVCGDCAHWNRNASTLGLELRLCSNPQSPDCHHALPGEHGCGWFKKKGEKP